MKPGARSKFIIVFESTIKIMIAITHTEKAIGKILIKPEEWQMDQRGFFYAYNSINAKVIKYLKGTDMK